MKATAIAPSNIAFIKYWGRKDDILRLPANGSLSMNLSNLLTTTTVEFNSSFTEDSITINGTQEINEGSRAIKHLDRVRFLAKIDKKAKVVTENNFPTGTGLSSSASGFAALSVAAAAAAGLNLSQKDLSILARQGSGSACRSIPDGFVEWLDGETSEESYAVSLYLPEYWDIVDVVAVVSKSRKEIATSEGHTTAGSSLFFPTRLSHIKNRIEAVKKALAEKDFTTFGRLVELEAMELHAIYLTSQPALVYIRPESLQLIRQVMKWREEGLELYFTLNTGQDVHILCEKKNEDVLLNQLKTLDYVQNTISNAPAHGARIVENHLF
jgi:diphosphomevalonate decarboxylase